MKVAALDLGTNTCLLLIAECKDGRIERVIHDEVRVIRLGQGVHETRRFHPDALVRVDACFHDYTDVIRAHHVDRILACATSAARDVTNQQELLDIATRHHIPIEIISGEREAELTFGGTPRAPLKEMVVVVDVGGGSTEFILGDQHGILARRSLDIGAVRLTEMFLTQHPVANLEFTKLDQFIADKLRDLGRDFPLDQARRMIAVAGTPTTLAALDLRQSFDAEKIDGYILSRSKIHAWVEDLAGMSVEQRQGLKGMEPKRADVIVAGGLILEHACRICSMNEVEVSIRGLRYGIAKSLSLTNQGAAHS